MSSTERDTQGDSEELARSKKARNESQTPGLEVDRDIASSPAPEVKEVTEGVKEVLLDDTQKEGAEKEKEEGGEEEKGAVVTSDGAEEELAVPVEGGKVEVAPESVPLPEDDLEDAPSSPAGSSEEADTAEADKENKAEVSATAESVDEAAPSSSEKEVKEAEEVEVSPKKTRKSKRTAVKVAPVEGKEEAAGSVEAEPKAAEQK